MSLETPESLLMVGKSTDSKITLNGEIYISGPETSQYLGIPKHTLSNLRVQDKVRHERGETLNGPSWVKLQSSNRIFYRFADVQRYKGQLLEAGHCIELLG